LYLLIFSLECKLVSVIKLAEKLLTRAGREAFRSLDLHAPIEDKGRDDPTDPHDKAGL
jgi:hypothetical protein